MIGQKHRARLLHLIGMLVIHGTVVGTIGLMVGALTWIGTYYLELRAAPAAAVSGVLAAALAMGLGELANRYIPRPPPESPR